MKPRLGLLVSILAAAFLAGCASSDTAEQKPAPLPAKSGDQKPVQATTMTKNYVAPHDVTGDATPDDRAIIRKSTQQMNQTQRASSLDYVPNTGLP